MNNFPKHAMVLAAGLGRRMRPLTYTLPKPMIRVAGRTIVDRAIDQLEAAGVNRIIVNTSYQAEILETHLLKRTSPEIIFSREHAPLETGGGIARALPYFAGKPFFCVNGDVIWQDKHETSALRQLAEHCADELDAVLLLYPREEVIGYAGNGDFLMDTHGQLTRRQEGEQAPYLYTGIQMLRPTLFANAPEGAFSLNRLYNEALATSPPRIKGVIYQGDLLHVGDPESLDLAEKYFSRD